MTEWRNDIEKNNIINIGDLANEVIRRAYRKRAARILAARQRKSAPGLVEINERKPDDPFKPRSR